MKKKILFLAPASIPTNGAEHIVNTKLLEALSIDGNFEIDLISKKNKWENYPSTSTFNDKIKLNSINIIEVDNKFNITTIWQHFLALLYFGVVFKGAHWAVKALPIAKQLIANNQYDYILTKNAPSLLLGYYLKKKYKLKWVATWNDPYPVSKYPHPYGLGIKGKESLSDKLQINIMKKWVDIHIFPSTRLRNYMNNYLNIPLYKTQIIPHVILANKIRRNNLCSESTLRFIHSGNLIYPRDPQTFIEGVSKFRSKYPNKKIEISIIGVYDKNFNELINKYKLQDIIKLIEPTSYENSLELLSQYHVSIIIEAQCEEGIFLPTKVSDFMQCGKYIYAISPKQGVLNDLYKANYISYYSPNTDSILIAEEINRIYEDFKSGELISRKAPIYDKYNSSYIVEQYKSI